MRERLAAASPPTFWSRWMSPALAVLIVVLVIQSGARDPLLLLVTCYVVLSAVAALPAMRARPRLARVLSATSMIAALLFVVAFLFRYAGAIR